MKFQFYAFVLSGSLALLAACSQPRQTTFTPEQLRQLRQLQDEQRLYSGDVQQQKTSNAKQPVASSAYVGGLHVGKDTVRAVLHTTKNMGGAPHVLKAFSVVVGSFSTYERAVIQSNFMINKGYEPFILPNEDGMFRVFVGTFDQEKEAEYLEIRLGIDKIPAWVLKQ